MLRPIPGFSAYAAKADGTVWRTKPAATRGLVPYQVRGGNNGKGYLRVKIYDNFGRKRTALIHQLVLLTFAGPRPSGLMHGCHRNGRKQDNRPCNLRWDTPAGNAADTAKHGTLAGERNPRAKLTVEQVRAARRKYTGSYGEVAALARKYKVSHSAMLSAVKGEHWRGC
jgi:hypothetical protein